MGHKLIHWLNDHLDFPDVELVKSISIKGFIMTPSMKIVQYIRRNLVMDYMSALTEMVKPRM